MNPSGTAMEAGRRAKGRVKTVRWGALGAFVGYALLCPLVGSAEWGAAVSLLWLGFLLWTSPPERSLSRPLNALFLAFLLLAATAFLPCSLFPIPVWRTAMEALGIHLPNTISPQPWLSLDNMVLLGSGLAWLYYACVREWNEEEHRWAIRLFCIGIIFIALFALTLHLTGKSISFWKSERNFGPFANRNNTANLFALGGLMILACSYDQVRRSRLEAALWLCATPLILFALTLSYSKSGILIFFLGSAAWLGVMASSVREKEAMGIAASAVAMLAALFFLFGGEVLGRFSAGGGGMVKVLTTDSRWALQGDAMRLGQASPWCGIGLGNFGDVIPQYREASFFSDKRAPHPDSDWVWLRVEMGWLAVVAVIVGCFFFGREILPLKHGSHQRLRSAAAIAVLFFALHGLVNVSGHAFGTAVPALFLLGLALSPGSNIRPARWPRLVFRSAAFVFALAGATWTIAIAQRRPIPGYIGLHMLKRAAESSYEASRFPEAIKLASQTIAISPLDWESYYIRGSATAFSGEHLPAALEDFARARHLFANSWKVPYQEGLCLLRVKPEAAIEPWGEALDRAGDQATDLFAKMLDHAKDRPAMLPGIKRMAAGNRDREVVLLTIADPATFAAEVARLRSDESKSHPLSVAQRESIIRLWIQKGDRELLEKELARDRDWRAAGWNWLASCYAYEQRYELAYKTAREFIPPPVLPPRRNDGSLSELRRTFLLDKSNFVIGYRLYEAQRLAGQDKEALSTLRKLALSPDCPPYFHFLEAELSAGMQEWEAAWDALARYEPGLKDSGRPALR